jgi:ribosomal protein RSM22 (predicted rRNA methylase)
VDLPGEIRAAIDARLEGVSRNALAGRSQAISEAYRAGRRSAGVIRDGADVAAYLAARMPATYAAVAAALHETAQILPDFAPPSLLDLGCGPGTASFAAVAQWPSIGAATLVDANAAFLDAAKALAAVLPALREARFVEADIGRWRGDQASLVLVAYALVELAEPHVPDLIQKLWEGCSGLLVLVEPGTGEGFRRLRIARDQLLRQGARVVAPCPHERACPIVAPDWCHFSQRLARTRDHMLVKGVSLPFEDEKFSYLAVVRWPVDGRPHARVLRASHVSKLGWTARLCTEGAAVDAVVSRRDPRFGRLRKLDWGDAVFDRPGHEPGR